QTLLTVDRGRYDGDLVGLVAADSPGAAKRAARAVVIRTTPLPAVLDFEQAHAAGAPLVHEQAESNRAFTDLFEWGDVSEGLAAADVVVSGSYFGPSAYHRPLEAATGALA